MVAMQVDSPRSGVAAAFAGALLLSFDTLILRLIDGDFLTVAFWRGLLMGLSAILLMLSRCRRTVFGSVCSPGARVVAGLYGLASVFFVLSVTFTSVANMLVIVATAPLWAALASYLLERDYRVEHMGGDHVRDGRCGYCRAAGYWCKPLGG